MYCNYLSYLLGILACFPSASVGSNAIIDGERAKKNQFPYQISFFVRGKLICGGGIIGEQFILAAAHCVINESTDRFFTSQIIILAGTNDRQITNKPAVVAYVQKIYVPADYKPLIINSTGDISVLKLRQPLLLSKRTHLKKLELPKQIHETYIDKTAKIAGFGWDVIKVDNGIEIGGHSDNQLRFADAKVIGPGHHHYFSFTNADKQICARIKQRGHSKTHGTCIGDSGGPLVYEDTAIGVLSKSPNGCSEKAYGALYTRVSSYLNFIEDAMEDKITHDMRIHEL